MNKSTLLASVIIAVSIIVAAALHAHMTKAKYQIAIGSDLMSTAVVNTNSGRVWLLANKQKANNFKMVSPGWYRPAPVGKITWLRNDPSC